MLPGLVGAAAPPPGSVQLTSSDERLPRAFAWAKQQALSYAHDEGDPVGPWYEAALPGRGAFCMRDVAHQAAGAEVLGLSRHNFNMLRKFALGIAKSRDWCSYWEIDRWDRPAPVDYENDTDFFYTLPANFDVVDACYRMFLWTGDRRYVDAPEFEAFTLHTLTDYIATWKLGPKDLMTRSPGNQEGPAWRRGIPSYEERIGGLALGLDTVAAESAAFRSYAAVLRLRGRQSEAARIFARSQALAKLIDERWWNPSAGDYYGFLTSSHQLVGDSNWFALYWDTSRYSTTLSAVLSKYAAVPLSENAAQVEDKSYRPEILYRYGYPKQALEQILDLCADGRNRREYPEVSYAVLGAMVNGMMGVQVEWRTSRNFEPVIRTLPSLPTETTWVEVRDLPILGTRIAVKHNGDQATVFCNCGSRTLTWRASFRGLRSTLLVDGRPRKAVVRANKLGKPVSSVDVRVPAGRHASVTMP